jgi:hypothetical protein
MSDDDKSLMNLLVERTKWCGSHTSKGRMACWAISLWLAICQVIIYPREEPSLRISMRRPCQFFFEKAEVKTIAFAAVLAVDYRKLVLLLNVV